MGCPVKPLKVKLSAGEQKATKICLGVSSMSTGAGCCLDEEIEHQLRGLSQEIGGLNPFHLGRFGFVHCVFKPESSDPNTTFVLGGRNVSGIGE